MAQQTLLQPVRPLPAGRISYEQFLEWLDEDTWAEWVDGEVQLMSPVSSEHQEVGSFLITILKLYVSNRQLGVVRYEPFQMKTGVDLPGRSPDILFVSNARRHLLRRTYLDGAADLVVEIVSAESEQRDRVQKFAEYERGGVREYWLIDPEKRLAEFYVLGEDGKYALQMKGEQGVYHSTVLEGFWLRMEWLWELPPEVQVLREWELV
ncbi:MAG: restriction endonuclease [Armatimonadota bacterium]|nr:MAG: restriction endonuclease [Armatimonadota bacterium]